MNRQLKHWDLRGGTKSVYSQLWGIRDPDHAITLDQKGILAKLVNDKPDNGFKLHDDDTYIKKILISSMDIYRAEYL